MVLCNPDAGRDTGGGGSSTETRVHGQQAPQDIAWHPNDPACRAVMPRASLHCVHSLTKEQQQAPPEWVWPQSPLTRLSNRTRQGTSALWGALWGVSMSRERMPSVLFAAQNSDLVPGSLSPRRTCLLTPTPCTERRSTFLLLFFLSVTLQAACSPSPDCN